MSDGIDAAHFSAHDFSSAAPQQAPPGRAQTAGGAIAPDEVTIGSRPPNAPSTIPAAGESPAAAQTQAADGRSFEETTRQLYRQVQAAYHATAAANHVAGHGQAREPQPDEASTIASNAQGGNVAFDSSNGHLGNASLHAIAQPGILQNQTVDQTVAVDNENSRRVQRESEHERDRAQDDADEDDDVEDDDEPETFAHLVRPMHEDRAWNRGL